MKFVRFTLITVVILALTLLIGRQIKKVDLPQRHRAKAAAQIPTVPVTRGTLTVTLAANGVLESAVETPVRSEISGNVVALCGNNTPVKPGDMVFRLDTKTYEAQYEDLAAELAEAESSITTLKADNETNLAQKKSDVAIADESYNLASAKAKAEMDKIQAQIDFSTGELARAESELARSKRLAALKYIAGTKLHAAEETYRKKQFDLTQQQAQLADAEKRTAEELQDKQSVLELARQSLEATRANAAANMEDACIKIEVAQRNLEEAQRTIEKCTITAPVAGLAVIGTNTDNWPERRPYRLGDQISSRAAPIMIYDLTQMQARCQIGEMDIERVHVGQQVFVSSATQSKKRYPAKIAVVEELAREANVWQGGTPGKRVFGVLINLSETDPTSLRPGMTVDLEIVLEKVPDVLMVPIRAVFTERGRTVVYRVRGQKVEPVTVTPGIRNDLQIAITGDIREGDLVSLERMQAKPSAKTDPESALENKPGQVVVSTTVKQDDLLFTVNQTGVIAAKKSVPVVPEISGRIRWVCENGIKVSRGDELLRLDTTQAEENLVKLAARYEETKRRLKRLEDVGDANMKQGQLQLKRTEDDVLAFERQNAVKLLQAKEQIDFHAKELEIQHSQLEVKRRMAAKGLLAGTEVEREEAAIKAKEFSLQKERSDYDLLKSQLDADATERHKNIDHNKQDIARTRMRSQRDVRMTRNEVDNLQLQLDRARADLAKMVITAQENGLVMLSMYGRMQGARLPMTGDWVSQGREFASIIALNQLQVRLELDQSQITGIKMAQQAEVTVEALKGKALHGKVTAIGQTARRPSVQGWTGVSAFMTFPVTIDLPPSRDLMVRPGMRATVNIIVRKIPNVLLVPSGCIFKDDGTPTVFVERHGVYTRIPVKTGESNGEYTIITQGVSAGERIALNNLGASPAGTDRAKRSK